MMFFRKFYSFTSIFEKKEITTMMFQTKTFIRHLRIEGTKYYEPNPENRVSVVGPQGQGDDPGVSLCMWNVALEFFVCKYLLRYSK
jgi:hypothetical protein